eukprot:Rhum_TRINITY_DN7760_c0_g1::Rhum_TRINITY_DN7760_c0_g1_i1::g.24584::m.24584
MSDRELAIPAWLLRYSAQHDANEDMGGGGATPPVLGMQAVEDLVSEACAWILLYLHLPPDSKIVKLPERVARCMELLGWQEAGKEPALQDNKRRRAKGVRRKRRPGSPKGGPDIPAPSMAALRALLRGGAGTASGQAASVAADTQQAAADAQQAIEHVDSDPPTMLRDIEAFGWFLALFGRDVSLAEYRALSERWRRRNTAMCSSILCDVVDDLFAWVEAQNSIDMSVGLSDLCNISYTCLPISPRLEHDAFTTLAVRKTRLRQFALPSSPTLTRLTRLVLSTCCLESVDAHVFVKMPSLEDLCLAQNNLEVLPETIASLHSLKSVDVSCNRLGLAFLASISDLPRLQRVNAASNRIVGVPAVLATHAALRLLDLHDNMIPADECDDIAASFSVTRRKEPATLHLLNQRDARAS